MRQTRNAAATFRRGFYFSILSVLASVSIAIADTAPTASVATEQAAPLSPDVDEVMEHLEPLWDSMRNDLVSYEVELKIYFNARPEVALTPIALRELWAKHDLDHSWENIPAFVNEIYGSQPIPVIPNHKIAIHGNHRRHELGQVTRMDVDSLCMIRDDANQQIRIHDRLRSPEEIPSLMLFRLPLNSREKGNRPTQVVRGDSTVQLSLDSPPHDQVGVVTTTATIDWATGIPLTYENVTKSGPLHEIIFSQLTTYASGISFPRLAVHVIYRNGKIDSMNIAQLVDARFNEPIDEDTFRMVKPVDYPVFDFRGSKEPLMLKLPKEQIDDLQEVLRWSGNNRAPLTDPVNVQQPMSNTTRTLLLINGVALIALGIWLWKRGSLAEPRH